MDSGGLIAVASAGQNQKALWLRDESAGPQKKLNGWVISSFPVLFNELEKQFTRFNVEAGKNVFETLPPSTLYT